ncbi:MAG: trehalose-6-phosphate synthase [Candidatus Zixiibacteriota bacterium]
MRESRLARFVSEVAGDCRIVVVSNREPVIHDYSDSGIRTLRPASGMVTALEPIIRAVRGKWVAHGSGTADRQVVDAHDRVGIPRSNPQYTLRRVWLSQEEEVGYYYGIANSAIWPMCHITFTRPQFARLDWDTYGAVNQKFCDAVLEEVGDEKAIVLIQDFHLALLPRLLRMQRPDLTIMLFWHIPWPNREAFRVFPWGEELLDGLLGSDLLGFHIQYHCNNFLDTVDRGIEAKVDYENFSVVRGGRSTVVRPFPISVDLDQIHEDAQSAATLRRLSELQSNHDLETGRVAYFVGMDRIDYTKGILERLQAFELLLRRSPKLRGTTSFLQFAAPSRTQVGAYQKLNEQVVALVEEINNRHQRDDWLPVHLLRAHHDYDTVLAAYHMADVLAVTSLHDGMNLVAKEFVSSRWDNRGVLMLSRFTGAARELDSALLINPYDIDELADSMQQALQMNREEAVTRMEKMREAVRDHDIYAWGERIFYELKRIQRGWSP